jgi:hypothetical protein
LATTPESYHPKEKMQGRRLSGTALRGSAYPCRIQSLYSVAVSQNATEFGNSLFALQFFADSPTKRLFRLFRIAELS